ncbi:hypothetical protein MTP99_014913 [Tenebrio molitor]|nr:hypothetical protein MTP99_014913 [Tenebrio molitor]
MFLSKINECRFLLVVITEMVLIGSCWSCGGRTIIHTGITDYDKKLLLDTHNKIRQVVAMGAVSGQPPASNMMELTWSDDLAREAQKWAMSCSPYIHDPSRHFHDSYVGQNLATKWTTRAPTTFYDMNPDWITDALSKWFAEYVDYSFSGYGYGNAETGHYTQLIWAETTSVGCGYSYYLDTQKRYHKKYVCNYGPSGNVQGEQPYEKGYPNCYRHRLEDSKSYRGLCEKSEKFNRHNDNDNENFVYRFYNYLG